MTGICAFFGHRDAPATDEIENKLEKVVQSLIEKGFDEFWVCMEGNFDWLSRRVVLRMKEKYPHQINTCYISAYNPAKFSKIKRDWIERIYELNYPEEAAFGLPKFAIERRNRYIADNADCIVCFVNRLSGGAYRAVARARKKGKTIINIANEG